MKVAWLNPTYGTPILLRNLLAMFRAQTYPTEQRRLFILEDAGQFHKKGWDYDWKFDGEDILKNGLPQTSHLRHAKQITDDFSLWASDRKFPTLTAKYAFLVQRALEWHADAFVVADTDDIYLPSHTADHVAVLQSIQSGWQWSTAQQGWINHGWSHSRTVYSLYTGHIVEEGARGRFHGALAFSREIGEQVGFWGDVHNGRCDYDQGIQGRLRALAEPGQSSKPPTYIYRWASTNADHCSGRCKGPDDTTWYDQCPISQPGHWDTLEPLMDAETNRIYEAWHRDPASLLGM